MINVTSTLGAVAKKAGCRFNKIDKECAQYYIYQYFILCYSQICKSKMKHSSCKFASHKTRNAGGLLDKINPKEVVRSTDRIPTTFYEFLLILSQFGLSNKLRWSI